MCQFKNRTLKSPVFGLTVFRFLLYLSFGNDSLNRDFVFPDLVLKDGVLLQEPDLVTQRPGLLLLRGLRKVLHLGLHPALNLRDVTLELE